MRPSTKLSRFRLNRLPPYQQDVVIACFTFLCGSVLYLAGLYELFGNPADAPFWLRIAVYGLLCSTQLLRRRAPGLALGLGTMLLAADMALLGLAAPPLVAFSDLVYAATLYGSTRLSRAMIPVAAIGTLSATAASLILAPDWRLGVLAAFACLPFLITPVWWAANVRQQRDIADSERANAAQLARIAELDREAAVASERSRMARDLHDIIAGQLSAIAIQSEAALSMATADERSGLMHTVLESVRGNSVDALAEMRAMIGLLRADDDGTERTAPARLSELSKLVESARASGMEVEVDIRLDTSSALPTAVDLTAYRIAQEALTNAVKHAPGGTATLAVRQHEGRVHVEVTNELGQARAAEGTGTGLLNMRERAQAIGGSFSAGPGGRGWQVSVVLPIPDGRTERASR
ncbi:sensor histidine kinase [Amycolatopsis cihanbeyliensis]|uniref:histidine kinase n=1 Tax=Amycolatopsis cihanbeyliensis TaxID=1128664 RepID=A0A542DDE5_AMYCI|nr:histidine kinase [Amycolatopsis cihanbeyliensis]TQJ01100.1 signal transduction histidine kinase [Amycolatopsis cihanbeyliensis]